MVKTKISFVCQECGYDTPAFLGKCPECGAWNSLKEIHFARDSGSTRFTAGGLPHLTTRPQKLNEITFSEKQRVLTGFSELDMVLGGGIVKGAVMLLAGDPGVGKSTLLLQLCMGLSYTGKKVLYISGEESVEQIKMRAERLGSEHPALPAGRSRSSDGSNGDEARIDKGLRKTSDAKRYEHRNRKTRTDSTEFSENLLLLSITNPDEAIGHIADVKPDFVVVDSIQTMQSENVAGLSGSVGQVRYGALHYIHSAKQNNIPMILVGHVTKEGMVAGPMVLSHMVDTVLFLEGEKFSKTRILRSLKNRFGPVDEVGIFLMEEEGLHEVTSPEQLFLQSSTTPTPGSVLVSTMEGSRAFLVELQALVVSSRLPMPRRVVSGIDGRRVELLLAVLQKHCRLPLDTTDVFVNVAGGMKLSDPGIDLGVCLAVYSSLQNIPLPQTVSIAEVGLLGELRSVSGLEKRVREAEKMGYKNVITSKKYKSLKEVLESLMKSEIRSTKLETNPKFK